MTETSDPRVGLLIGEKYTVKRKIGVGAFGCVFRGGCSLGNGAVCIKLEPISATYPQLLYEAQVYKALNPHGNVQGIPRALWSGHTGDYNALVLDLLGPSLDDYFHYCGCKFSLKTVLMLADQMLLRLEYLHKKGFVHRDLKPHNFLMGANERTRHQLYLIDFGLAKKYIDSDIEKHIPLKEGKSMVGNARFASLNAHLGYELSRRDDLESLGYILIYLLRGALPWQELGNGNLAMVVQLIGKAKQEMTDEELCQGLPGEFLDYLKTVRKLQFTEEPDYNALREKFHSLLKRQGFHVDYIFDWIVKRFKEGS